MAALQDLGYPSLAQALELESNVQLEHPAVSRLFEMLSQSSPHDQVCTTLSQLEPEVGMGTIEGMRFALSKMHYLQEIKARRFKEALQILQDELTPKTKDLIQVQQLAALMINGQHNTIKEDRESVISTIRRSIPPDLVAPRGRLEQLLKQAQQFQVANCVNYHFSSVEDDLLRDHGCARTLFEQIEQISLRGTSEVCSLAIGDTIVAGELDGTLEYKNETKLFHSRAVSKILLMPNGFLSSSLDERISCWRYEDDACKVEEPTRSVGQPVLDMTWIGNHLLVAVEALGGLQVFSFPSLTPLVTGIKTRIRPRHFVPNDENKILLLDTNGTIHRIVFQESKIRLEEERSFPGAASVSISRNTVLARYIDGKVALFPKASDISLLLSEDSDIALLSGDLVFIGTGSMVQIRSITDGHLYQTIDCKEKVNYLGFCEGRLAIATGQTITISKMCC